MIVRIQSASRTDALLPFAATRVTPMLAALLALTGATQSRADIAWSFESSSQGWRIADLNCGGNYTTPLSQSAVVWQPTGGNPGGYIQQVDPSGNCFFFDAPASDLGNLSAFVGKTFAFSLRTTLSDYVNDNVVVMIGTNGTVLVAQITPVPTAAWSHYTIALNAANFRRNSKTGPAATAQELTNVLSSLAALRISAEYGSVVAETSGLDSVAFVSQCVSITSNPPSQAACPAATATLSVVASGSGSLAFQWQRETAPNTWVNTDNGDVSYAGGTITVSGATTSQVQLTPNTPPGAPPLRWRCIVTNACGNVSSNPGTLAMLDPSDPTCTSCNPCAADYNSDGGVDGGDVDAFFIDWVQGASCADVNQDGGVDGSDVDTFFVAWSAGGC